MKKFKKIKINLKKKDASVKKQNDIGKFKSIWQHGSIGIKILTIIMGALVFFFTIGIVFFIYVVISAPDFDPERLITKESSIVYDSEGNEIARLGTENREKVTYDQLPEVFIDALVATEDSRFFQHNGLDMARFLKATAGQLLGNSSAGGASTLTMQVVKQRYTDPNASGIKGIIRKFTDIYMSVFKIEKNYTKEQIIEYYVNIPYLGSGTYGIEQASETYFGKPISELTLSEAAMIAGLFQAPDAYDPFNYPDKAEARRNQVLNLMERHGYISDEECEIAKSISVKSLLIQNSSYSNVNQGFIDTVVAEVKKRTGKNPYTTSMKIYSTMKQAKQDTINNINTGTTMTWPNDNIQTGIVATDVDTGAIVAVGAGRNRKGVLSYNYATMINRHPGSTAKPIFDYGPAIEYLNYSTGTTIVDDQYTYSNGGYIRNWDNSYKGIMTAKSALAASRNIPALQTFQALSQDQIKKFVTGLGITPEYDANGYINESHAIGGFNGTNPLEMSAAYAAFARGGIYIEPYSFTKVEFVDTGETYTVTPEKRTVMSEATAYMINMILKYAVTNSYVSAGSKSGTDVASKTGTSTVDSNVKKEFGIKVDIIGDSWQMVYSPDYVCAVWVGYPKISSTTYLTDSQGGIVKRAIVKQLTSGILEPNSRWTQPSSVVAAEVELETIPLELASSYTPSNLRSTEYFKKGTVPSDTSVRFNQLDNPTNLKISNSGVVTSLTWTGISTPNAIDKTWLQNYFTEGYKTFAEKYLQKRLDYNSSNIGTNGYEVYINTGSGYTDLGFTTNTSYTYPGIISSDATFMVKSAYSIFKSNMSSGATVSLNSSTNTNTSKNAEVIGGTMTVKQYQDYVNANNSILNYTTGESIASSLFYTSYYDTTTNGDVNINSVNDLDCSHSYEVSYRLKGTTKTYQRVLNPGC